MRISWKWLSEMVDLSAVGGPKGLADLLTARGLEVEAVESLSEGFDQVVSAKILERNKHPQADRLSLCQVSIGQGEPLEIVCGAQNMKAGDIVALAQIGASLPNGLKITQSKIRGVTSNGMLCSEEELKLKDSSEGILILPPSTPLGKPLAEILGRDDTILTLKLTANRGDCLSHWGIAREVAAALGSRPKRPEPKLLDLKGSPISIHLDAGESAPQFYGCLIEGVKIGPSPEWVVKRLEALGSRSINNVVDASNLVLFELGFPTHAYDADRIEGKEIRVRMAKAGEELPLLDGKTITLAGTELVISDGKRAVGLAGVMGGGNSEVQPGTTRIFLECAEFNPTLVRRAAFKHQRRTEAAQRFEKGIDPQGLHHAVSRLANLIVELAGGTIKSSGRTILPSRDASKIQRTLEVESGYFSKFLGFGPELSSEKIEQVLASNECRVIEKNQGRWKISIPSYRNDLVIREDLAEEVARSIGYDAIPTTVPPLTTMPKATAGTPSAARLELINRAKDTLAQLGLFEAVNLGFTSRAWLSQLANFEASSGIVKVTNPISEECELMNPSLLPGLIKNALENWRRHFGSEAVAIRLFELRPTFHVSETVQGSGEMDTNVQERWKLAFAISGPRYASGLRNEQGEVDFYDLKAILDSLFERLGVKGVRYQPLKTPDADPVATLLHPGQSVEILAGNGIAGKVGLFHPGKAKALKARAPLWIGELDWELLAQLSRPVGQERAFKAWSEFPPIERDFALLVKSGITADKITQVAMKSGKPLAKVAKIFDVYRGSQVVEGMTSIAVRVIFSEEGRSLQEAEADAASARILEAWNKELGIQLRS
jgi:phenylalanyl-tRNA synthetase beta chain